MPHTIQIYTLDGREVTSLEGLKDGQFYVALDRPPLKLPPFTVGEDGWVWVWEWVWEKGGFFFLTN